MGPIIAKEYIGPDQIYVVNGIGLTIKDNDASKLSTPIISFLLHVLYVPQITKNLLFVKKFTATTNIFFEFHPSCIFVKDRATW